MQSIAIASLCCTLYYNISQQIFNILTAQAVTTDYDENYFRRAGIDIGETIRLDANDLFMSLAGPVAVAYAESVIPPDSSGEKLKMFDKASGGLNIDDLFFRSIDLPHFNKVTQAIEGISLLPIESSRYRETLAGYVKNGYNASELKDLHFFKNCSSVVSIISLPKDYKLSYMDLNRLKSHLNSLFPNTTLKRYALVIGASANISLTTLIVVLVLLIFGGEVLRGFSFALFIGIVVGTYSSIYIGTAFALWRGLNRQDFIVQVKPEFEDEIP